MLVWEIYLDSQIMQFLLV